MIDQYQMVREIAMGGMASVWEVRHPHHNIPLALKLLPSERTKTAMISALEQEIRILASLEHPGIVRILDFGYLSAEEAERILRPEGTPWLVMEHAGQLEALVDLKPRSWVFFRQLFQDILSVLAHIHSRGIVHRDISPSNIMWDKRDHTVKLIDFGTAYQAHEDIDLIPYATQKYRAPEHLNRELLGPWTDLFSVGVLFSQFLSAIQNPPMGLPRWIARLCHPQISHRYHAAAPAIEDLLALSTDTLYEAIIPSTSRGSDLITRTITEVIEQMPAETQVTQTASLPSHISSQMRRIPQAPPDPMQHQILGWQVRETSLFPYQSSILVGRQAEIKWLWAQLHQTQRTSRLRVINIKGEQGVGISHLIQWFIQACAELGVCQHPNFHSNRSTMLPSTIDIIVATEQNTEWRGLLEERETIERPILIVKERDADAADAELELQRLPEKDWYALVQAHLPLAPLEASWLAWEVRGHPKTLQQTVSRLITDAVVSREEKYFSHRDAEQMITGQPQHAERSRFSQQLNQLQSYQQQGAEGICQIKLLQLWSHLSRIDEQERLDFTVQLWSTTVLNVLRTYSHRWYSFCLDQRPPLSALSLEQKIQMYLRLLRLYQRMQREEELREAVQHLDDVLHKHSLSIETFPLQFEYAYFLGLRGQFHAAYQRFLVAEALASRHEHTRFLAHAQIGLGLASQWIGQFQESLRYFSAGEQLFLQLEDTSQKGNIWDLRASVYLSLEEYEQAKEAVQQSIRYYTAAGQPNRAVPLLNQAAITHHLQNREKTLEIIDELLCNRALDKQILLVIHLYQLWYAIQDAATSDIRLALAAHAEIRREVKPYHPLIGRFYRDIIGLGREKNILEEQMTILVEWYQDFWGSIGWELAERWGCSAEASTQTTLP